MQAFVLIPDIITIIGVNKDEKYSHRVSVAAFTPQLPACQANYIHDIQAKTSPPLSSASLTGASMSQKRGCESGPVPPGTEDADLPDVKKK